MGKAGAHLNVLEAKHYAIAPSDMDEVRGSEARARCDVVDARVLEELEVAIEARKLRDVISSRAARPARNEARARRDAVDGTLRQGLRVAIFNALRLPIFVALRLPTTLAVHRALCCLAWQVVDGESPRRALALWRAGGPLSGESRSWAT